MILHAALALIFLPVWAVAQTGEEEDPLVPAAGTSLPPVSSRQADSAAVRIAMIEIAKAEAEAGATSFIRRLIPSVTVGGTFGVRDLVFPDPGGTVVYPKDSYRISATLSVSGLIDGSKHALAQLAREEAEARLALLVQKQEAARTALRRKAVQLRSELSALEEELAVWQSLAAYQEILFTQGRADFRAVARARIDGIRLRGAVARASAMFRAVEDEIAGGEEK